MDNPLKILLRKVYNSGRYGATMNNIDQKQDAKREYQMIHQRDDQSLLDFMKTMLAAIDRMEELGIEIPEGQDLATDFIWKLDKKQEESKKKAKEEDERQRDIHKEITKRKK